MSNKLLNSINQKITDKTIDLSLLPETFCFAPFFIYSTDFSLIHGLCSSYDSDKLSDFIDFNSAPQSPSDVWTSERLIKLRSLMISGERLSFCEKCYKCERKGNKSERYNFNKFFIEMSPALTINLQNGNSTQYPTIIEFVDFSNKKEIINFRDHQNIKSSFTSFINKCRDVKIMGTNPSTSNNIKDIFEICIKKPNLDKSFSICSNTENLNSTFLEELKNVKKYIYLELQWGYFDYNLEKFNSSGKKENKILPLLASLIQHKKNDYYLKINIFVNIFNITYLEQFIGPILSNQLLSENLCLEFTLQNSPSFIGIENIPLKNRQIIKESIDNIDISATTNIDNLNLKDLKTIVDALATPTTNNNWNTLRELKEFIRNHHKKSTWNFQENLPELNTILSPFDSFGHLLSEYKKNDKYNLSELNSFLQCSGVDFNKISDTFCVVPFAIYNIDCNSKFGLCLACNKDLLYSFFGKNTLSLSLTEIWKSKKIILIREKMLKGEKLPFCENCYQNEKRNTVSERNIMNDMFNSMEPIQAIDIEYGNSSKLPKAFCLADFTKTEEAILITDNTETMSDISSIISNCSNIRFLGTKSTMLKNSKTILDLSLLNKEPLKSYAISTDFENIDTTFFEKLKNKNNYLYIGLSWGKYTNELDNFKSDGIYESSVFNFLISLLKSRENNCHLQIDAYINIFNITYLDKLLLPIFQNQILRSKTNVKFIFEENPPHISIYNLPTSFRNEIDKKITNFIPEDSSNLDLPFFSKTLTKNKSINNDSLLHCHELIKSYENIHSWSFEKALPELYKINEEQFTQQINELLKDTNALTSDYYYFEWFIVDMCNLNCSYCIAKDNIYRKETKKEKLYTEGNELIIAKKIKELSLGAKKVRVNLTGGEPLMAKYICEVLDILLTIPNIEILINTNFILIDKIEKYVPKLKRICLATHLQEKNDESVDKLIKNIEKYSHMGATDPNFNLWINIVDHKVTEREKRYLEIIDLISGNFEVACLNYIEPKDDNSKEKNISNKNSFKTFSMDYLKDKYINIQKIEELINLQNESPQENISKLLFKTILYKSNVNKNNSDHIDDKNNHNFMSNLQKTRDEQMKKYNYLQSKGKRCCLGHSTFLIEPDGALYSKQWCTGKSKSENIFQLTRTKFQKNRFSEMKKCPMNYCHCNYNYFIYEDYLKICLSSDYDIQEVFEPLGRFDSTTDD